MRRSGWEEPLEPVPLGVGEIAWREWRHAVQRRSCRLCPSLQNTLSELVAGLAPLVAPGKGEDLGGRDREQQKRFHRAFIP